MLLAGLLAEPYSLKAKLAMVGFFVLGSLLPSERAKTLLAYRSKNGERSVLGFAAEFFRFRAPVGS